MTFSTYSRQLGTSVGVIQDTLFGTRSSGRVPSAMEFLDMEKFTSILCLFVCFEYRPYSKHTEYQTKTQKPGFDLCFRKCLRPKMQTTKTQDTITKAPRPGLPVSLFYIFPSTTVPGTRYTRVPVPGESWTKTSASKGERNFPFKNQTSALKRGPEAICKYRN